MQGISGRTTVTLSDHLRAAGTRRRKFTLAAVVLVIAMITISNIPSRFDTTLEIAISAVALIITVLAFVVMWLVVMVVGVAISAARLSNAQRDVTYTFDADGFAIRDAAGAAFMMPWSGIGSVRERARAFVVTFKPSGSRYVPKRAFDAEQLAPLRALLSDKLAASAKVMTPR